MSASQSSSWLHRQFPHAPSRQQLIYVRLPFVVWGMVTCLLFIFGEHSTRTLAIAGCWFQLNAAALFWFESKADRAKISLVIRDLRLPLISPETFAEKGALWIGRLSSVALQLFFLLIGVAGALAIATKLHSWQLAKVEVLWIGYIALGLAAVQLLPRGIGRYMENLRKLLRQPGRSDTDDETAVRQFLRTIETVLLFVGVTCQLIAVALA